MQDRTGPRPSRPDGGGRQGRPGGPTLGLMWSMMRDHPRLVRSLMRGWYKKYLRSNLDHCSRSGRSGSLWLISLRITDRCNHRCAICGQFGSKGYNLGSDHRVAGTLPLETYIDMIDEVSHLRPHIYITGGEPFMYEGLVPLVRHIKERGLTVQVVTNGSFLERHAEDIVGDGWDWLCYSLDGPAEVHNRCRGVSWAYDRLLRGVRRINEVKAETGRTRPFISSVTTLSAANSGSLLETLEEAERLAPDCMAVYYSWFTSEEVGRRHTKVMQDALGCTPFAWKSYVRDASCMDVDRIADQVRAVKARRRGCPTLFIPDIGLDELAAYYKEPENFLGWRRCLAPWFQLDVMPNGDVVNCRDFPDLVMGNIARERLLDIYNNERFRAFRRTLQSAPNGVLPICSRCCGLMGF